MKNFKKGFTLVEMLIVVVIIGILSAALLPRLQGAQSSARDAARRSDLNQLGSAILSYYNNRGEYPWLDKEGTTGCTYTTGMIPASCIKEKLMQVVELSSLPTDPNKGNSFKFGSSTISGGQYGYVRVTKNTLEDGGYLLMARTETEGGSNFLSTIAESSDLNKFKMCTSFEEAPKGQSGSTSVPESGKCLYENKGQLRYVYVF